MHRKYANMQIKIQIVDTHESFETWAAINFQAFTH